MEKTEEIEKPMSDDEQDTPLIKMKKSVGRPKNPPKIKEKKPRTDKQIAAFAKVVEKNKEYKAKKLEEKKIESAKLLLANGIELPNVKAKQQDDDVVEPTPPVKRKSKPIEEEAEEVENEIIYVKQPRKGVAAEPKPKKKRKIIVYQDQSSDESSSEEEQEVHIKSKSFKTQQNKKSLIKVHDKKKPLDELNHARNFFCD